MSMLQGIMPPRLPLLLLLLLLLCWLNICAEQRFCCHIC
jgi:hypothetical protein